MPYANAHTGIGPDGQPYEDPSLNMGLNPNSLQPPASGVGVHPIQSLFQAITQMFQQNPQTPTGRGAPSPGGTPSGSPLSSNAPGSTPTGSAQSQVDPVLKAQQALQIQRIQHQMEVERLAHEHQLAVAQANAAERLALPAKAAANNQATAASRAANPPKPGQMVVGSGSNRATFKRGEEKDAAQYNNDYQLLKKRGRLPVNRPLDPDEAAVHQLAS